MQVRGRDFFCKLPYELWAMVLFSSGVLSAKDILNLFSTCLWGAFMAGKFKSDPYMLRLWEAMLTPATLIERGWMESLCTRIIKINSVVQDPHAVLDAMAAYEGECRWMCRSALVVGSQITTLPRVGTSSLHTLAKRFKNAQLLMMYDQIVEHPSRPWRCPYEVIELITLCQSEELLELHWPTSRWHGSEPLINKQFDQMVQTGWLYGIQKFWNERRNVADDRWERVLETAIRRGYMDVFDFAVNVMRKDPMDVFFSKELKAISTYNDVNDYIKVLSHIRNDQDDDRLDFVHLKDFTFACAAGNMSIVRHLLGQRDVSAQAHEAFMAACVNGHMQVVDLLIELSKNDTHPMPPKIWLLKQNQAFRMAAKAGRTAIVRKLIDLEVQRNSHDASALRMAAANGHFEVVKVLIETPRGKFRDRPLNIRAKDDAAIRKAYQNGHDAIGDYLCDKINRAPALFKF